MLSSKALQAAGCLVLNVGCSGQAVPEFNTHGSHTEVCLSCWRRLAAHPAAAYELLTPPLPCCWWIATPASIACRLTLKRQATLLLRWGNRRQSRGTAAMARRQSAMQSSVQGLHCPPVRRTLLPQPTAQLLTPPQLARPRHWAWLVWRVSKLCVQQPVQSCGFCGLYASAVHQHS